MRIESKGTHAFPVEVLSRFTGEATGRLLFISRGDGVGTANATTLVFSLRSVTTIGAPMHSDAAESRLYQPAMLPLAVTSGVRVRVRVRVRV